MLRTNIDVASSFFNRQGFTKRERGRPWFLSLSPLPPSHFFMTFLYYFLIGEGRRDDVLGSYPVRPRPYPCFSKFKLLFTFKVKFFLKILLQTFILTITDFHLFFSTP